MGRTFRDLKVWQKAHQLTLLTYALTDKFPKHELYSLTQQLRRAAVSVSANIVEGSKRNSDRDTAHFLNLAAGSLEETKYLFLLARDLTYLTESEHKDAGSLSNEVGLMLNGLHKFLRRSHSKTLRL